MQVGSARSQLPFAHRLNRAQAVNGNFGVDHVRRAVFMRFFYRAGRPVAGIDVVGNGFIAKQVQRDTGKLSATAAVAE